MFTEFLPVSRDEMTARGWYFYDFLVVTGDAYVDHPSFGTAVIARLLESEGYRVAVLSQPRFNDESDFLAFGVPRYAVLVGAGNLDSMVAHYTAAKKKRHDDYYSPGKKSGLRPDRASIVYCQLARKAFPDTPIILGGIEASLRRFSHYDYWDDRVRRSVLFDSGADLLTYGMGEYATVEIANGLKAGSGIEDITGVRGTAFVSSSKKSCKYEFIEVPSFEDIRDSTTASKRKYAEANITEYREHDPISGKAVIQKHGSKYLIVNPPQMPLRTPDFDRISELPYTRQYHPMYEPQGGVPAIDEVKFSVIHNRGCFGACNFCALAFHQGRMITVRSHESIIREVELLTRYPDFKGYIHDVGGPTANFRHASCKQQLKNGMCKNRNCLTPEPCKNLDTDHSDYLSLLRKIAAIPRVKKVFVRSGIRFDYLVYDKNDEFFSELVKNHISGQLKVAPEHCIDGVLDYMGKPPSKVYERFYDKYRKLNAKYSKNQFLVPYLISSHPGSAMSDAVALAEYLRDHGVTPEQVQDFYPTPGTLSTCMYYTGLDPRTMKPVYVPRNPKEKAMQRALLQYKLPQNRELVISALKAATRTDLIGFGRQCLVRPQRNGNNSNSKRKVTDAKSKRS